MNRVSLFCLAGAYICLSAYAQVKMSPDGDHSDVLKVDMTARRPCTEGPEFGNLFKECVVPENKEVNPGAGIRVNGDTESAADENDLIKVELKVEPFPVPSGVTFILKCNNTKINVWDSRTMNNALLESETEAAITFSAANKTVWVEDPSGGDADLELVARSGGTDICSDKVHFYPFTSIVIALGGETQNPSDPASTDHGMFQLATNLYQEGYDVHMYDEDDVDYSGAGAVYNEVVNAVQHRDVKKVAIYGYSHGGGSTYVLSSVLSNNYTAIGSQFTIPYTAYVDAVQDDGIWDPKREQRRPMGSVFHANYYQEGHIADFDYGLDGGPLIPSMQPDAGYEENVDQPDPTETHGSIDDEPTILHDIFMRITTKMKP